MLTPTSTPPIAGTGNKNSNANSIVLKSKFFISFPRHRRYGIFIRVRHTVLLPAGLGYRFPSETRVAVCPIPGPVFVLWQVQGFFH